MITSTSPGTHNPRISAQTVANRLREIGERPPYTIYVIYAAFLFWPSIYQSSQRIICRTIQWPRTSALMIPNPCKIKIKKDIRRGLNRWVFGKMQNTMNAFSEARYYLLIKIMAIFDLHINIFLSAL